MRKPNRIIATIAIFCIPASGSAEPAQVGASANFEGSCQHIHNKDTSVCNKTVANLRFIDGYDSFQFREGNVVTTFVGRSWKDNSGPNSVLPDNVLFMPLDQIVVTDRSTGKTAAIQPQGQCVLTFKTPTLHDVQSVTKIWCEYAADNKNNDGNAFWLGDLSEKSVEIVEGQNEAAARGFKYYR